MSGSVISRDTVRTYPYAAKRVGGGRPPLPCVMYTENPLFISMKDIIKIYHYVFIPNINIAQTQYTKPQPTKSGSVIPLSVS